MCLGAIHLWRRFRHRCSNYEGCRKLSGGVLSHEERVNEGYTWRTKSKVAVTQLIMKFVSYGIAKSKGHNLSPWASLLCKVHLQWPWPAGCCSKHISYPSKFAMTVYKDIYDIYIYVLFRFIVRQICVISFEIP